MWLYGLQYSQRNLDFLMYNCGFLRLKNFTNLVPIVYLNKYSWLWWFNRIFMRTGLGGGIIALYKNLSTKNEVGEITR